MRQVTANQSYEASIAINRVLRKTYLLLSLTLIFSACVAYAAMITNARPVNILLFLVGWFGLYFLTMKLRNSRWGVLSIFLFTGFLGYTLGPILNFYIHGYTNGSAMVMTALGATGVIFLGLSSYVLVSKKDFSYLGGFIAAAAMLLFLGGLASIFFQMPMLNLLISGGFALISSAFILYTTSTIITGGETNYILATVSLYIAIFNLFMSLLRILSFFTGNRN